MRAQFQARQEGALEWRIRRANLPERCSLETFPFARQPAVNRKQIRGFVRGFAELEFITKAENIVLVGETGRGKTGLACSLLAEGAGERLSLPIRQSPGLIRRDVCLGGGSIFAAVAQAPGATGRPFNRRIRVFESETRAVQHLFQADGGALPPAFHNHYNKFSCMGSGRTSWAIARWWKRC